MSYKVSVVIPVFNAEKYLDECITSLINQTLKDCEFIFVNDGSTDTSRLIIEGYQIMDDRIVLLNQDNQGVSQARNAALSIASGEYIGFVDADDFIKTDMYQKLYETAKQKKCDVVITNFESVLDGCKCTTQFPFPPDQLLDRQYIEQKIMPYFLKADDLNSVWNKLYRRELIINLKISFPQKTALGEDAIFNMLFFGFASTMSYIKYNGYYYREVLGSASRNITKMDYFGNALEVYLMDPPAVYSEVISKTIVNRFKSIRLINSTISYINLYIRPSKEISFSKRYSYIKRMINNHYVREAIPIYFAEMQVSLGRYEKFILNMIRARFIFGLICGVTYSRIRNN
ncbi:glycosyltransferase involved in cell wall biosynthesis [Paenibacillus endophyticus]|uniref:Glycosyltransferase involved in cell wall biosynthesis n=1 Tax=Paenibacillus endophyticus TaxID=1294268 RepID=A0A7W5C2I5_9BACL|nr:glycosyltransferase [Paenibacillus endophyticus]MBB3150047.1 glycosyltransferase involved in cell wall biosynthesis [Paenibacillus endophyticus]